ncbi:MAG TPA: hypothetical protein VFC51_13090 [Chloroflexota bacterium]|nr:hypothetical protein [Chloroflexota bacterium]
MRQPQAIFYMEGHRVTGAVVTGRERVSDYLNNPNSSTVEVHDATFEELLTDRQPETAARLTVLKSEISLVVPTDMGDVGVGTRVPTQPVRVELACPLYSIVGSLHHRSSDPTDLAMLLKGFNRTFVPLTEASMRYLPNARYDAEERVVLVNTEHLQFWGVLPHASA